MEVNEFINVMRGLSDDELLEILNKKRKDYQPKAIEAVEIVLKERNVQYVKLDDGEIFEKEIQETSVAERCCINGDWKRYIEYIIDTFAISLLSSFFTPLTGVLSFIIALVIYYGVMEATAGKTFGKMVLGLKVVDIDGNKPTTKMILIRTLCRLIPFEPISFILGDWKNHTLTGCWHDSISKTYVVYEKILNHNSQSVAKS